MLKCASRDGSVPMPGLAGFQCGTVPSSLVRKEVNKNKKAPKAESVH